MFKGTNIPVAIALAYCFSCVAAVVQSKDPLIFPKDNFTVENRMVKTGGQPGGMLPGAGGSVGSLSSRSGPGCRCSNCL